MARIKGILYIGALARNDFDKKLTCADLQVNLSTLNHRLRKQRVNGLNIMDKEARECEEVEKIINFSLEVEKSYNKYFKGE